MTSRNQRPRAYHREFVRQRAKLWIGIKQLLIEQIENAHRLLLQRFRNLDRKENPSPEPTPGRQLILGVPQRGQIENWSKGEELLKIGRPRALADKKAALNIQEFPTWDIGLSEHRVHFPAHHTIAQACSATVYVSWTASRCRPMQIVLSLWISVEAGPHLSVAQPPEYANKYYLSKGPDRRRSGPLETAVLLAFTITELGCWRGHASKLIHIYGHWKD